MRKWIFLSLALTACNDAGQRDDLWETGRRAPPAWLEYRPQSTPVSLLRLVDAAGQPLAGTEIALYPTDASSSVATDPVVTTLTDSSGELASVPLGAGEYRVQLIHTNISADVRLTVTSNNALAFTTVTLPVLLERDGSLKPLGRNYFVAATSGQIHDVHGPVMGAQVSIGAGPISNGAIATAVTGSDGGYELILPVGGAVVPALSAATLQVTAPGHRSLVQTDLDISQWGALAGLNLALDIDDTSGDAVYRESFDTRAEGAVCGAWTGSLVYTSTAGNLWHEHTPGRGVINGAVDAGLVSLAPDDHSQGYIPDPVTGNACWYGKGDGEIFEVGNYLGTAMVDQDGAIGGEPLGGGTSTAAHAAALVSPVIDLSREAAPLALSFDTWWEIEAINPNKDGFDLMQIEVREVGETQWQPLARLNPLADPQTLTPDMPYSNRGYNRAPAWLRQEPISLDAFAGRRLQLRFAFYSEDEYYNGFRGWLVDNVAIARQTGSFPLWTDVGGR